mgnify:CR=1 FL=1
MGFDIDGDSGEIKVSSEMLFPTEPLNLPLSGLPGVRGVRLPASQEVGPQARGERRLHDPAGGPDHHG